MNRTITPRLALAILVNTGLFDSSFLFVKLAAPDVAPLTVTAGHVALVLGPGALAGLGGQTWAPL